MKTQIRPFVVEVKKSKRVAEPSPEAPAGDNPSGFRWDAPVLPSALPASPSEARRAADAVFSALLVDGELASGTRRAGPEAEPSRPAIGRILWVEPPLPPDARPDDPARRGRGRPRKSASSPAPALDAVPTRRPGRPPTGGPVAPEPQRLPGRPAAETPAADVVPRVAPAFVKRRSGTGNLPRGERWKSRLPRFCR